ncbi:uncharacterized protein LOC119674888 [Teleopsis dalmanni]|uniref:uncharacterized protein LOC119674888 n=1 Tax=Teleopsis dalmanni TaxID=139649 RepID=UPI0018CDFF85|nr:uncharacterized protein LOC119674888 [Teleopsis dalmanni]
MFSRKINVRKIFFFQFFLLYALRNVVAESITIPPLHSFEDYDSCLALPSPNNTYCVVFAEIIPNATSTLWKNITQLSSDFRYNYRHDHLFFGVCLNTCINIVKSLNTDIEKYITGEIKDNELASYYDTVHKNNAELKANYKNVTNICLNYKFMEKYNLKLRTYIEYCQSGNSTPFSDNDTLDIIAYYIFGVILVLNIASSIYDYALKKKKSQTACTKNFYKEDLNTNVEKILTSFSFLRNYHRLTRRPNPNDLIKNLEGFNVIRIIGVYLVISAHVYLLVLTSHMQNSEFIETMLKHAEAIIIQNGTAFIQIFFIISGFLLNFTFNQKQMVTPSTDIKQGIVIYFKIFILRYIRFLPSLLLYILFTGTILNKLQDGPLWLHIAQPDRTFCREYWWKNILFINNFFMKYSCSHQTWYLAADMQLFELFLIITIITAKYPNLKKYIYFVLILCAFLIPSLLTYYLNLEPIYHMYPDYVYELFKKKFIITYQSMLLTSNKSSGYFDCDDSDSYSELSFMDEYDDDVVTSNLTELMMHTHNYADITTTYCNRQKEQSHECTDANCNMNVNETNNGCVDDVLANNCHVLQHELELQAHQQDKMHICPESDVSPAHCHLEKNKANCTNRPERKCDLISTTSTTSAKAAIDELIREEKQIEQHQHLHQQSNELENCASFNELSLLDVKVKQHETITVISNASDDRNLQ